MIVSSAYGYCGYCGISFKSYGSDEHDSICKLNKKINLHNSCKLHKRIVNLHKLLN